ncbi:hypothetical protein Dthio_PD1572 [Desulfonatronospira thiodismutans ASO3-1]|uniref:Glycosyl transferase family 2 n=1 Tax=Desulfonatronospira thiodismutans ASO3-1 TaxID=555779 RepID=D6SN95_9BACT|nr:TIGR00180 family glycosyltransferase [Desulfonatronospira thiodismutans]EFI34221.1 hypothetical protein Dthio_PD1572 [Desulfonatronospira thiodismutans ASO3-1]
MPILFIPTKNRPASLSWVLNYLARFYPDTRVVIADGSDECYKASNMSSVEKMQSGLSVNYKTYSQETGFIDRCLDALNSEPEEYIVFGADDDYPNMELMFKGEKFLKKNPDFSTAMGARVVLNLKKDEVIRSRLAVVRPVECAEAWQRMKIYSKWSFATTYAVTRRRHLLKRFKRLKQLAPIGFYDFMVGLHDAACGKIKAYPEVGFFTTRTYTHNFIRNTDKLFFIHNSKDILKLQEIVREDLEFEGLLTTEETEKQSEIIMLNRIAELTGRDFRKLANFSKSKLFNDHIVQSQYKLYNNIFDLSTKEGKKYSKHLRYIYQAMQSIVESSNRLEGKFVNTLDGKPDQEKQGSA